MINKLKYIRDKGLHQTFKELYLRLTDKYYDKFFGVHTYVASGDINAAPADKESVNYYTIHYKELFFLFDQISVPKTECTILDYGCGRGRVVTAAAAYDFREIIGLEISPLISIANTNLDRMKNRKTKAVKLLQGDAKDYQIPSDVNVIYFYNPFLGSILESVIRNIQFSLETHPRKVIIIYVNNDHFDIQIQGLSWISKKRQGELSADDCYGIYHCS